MPQLKQKVDDVALWRTMLHMLCEHLHLHRHHVLELQTLFILLHVYELSPDEGGTDIPLAGLSIAQLLLQLGHTFEAGVHLNKVRDNLASSSVSLLIQADYHATLAQYYFDLGNFEQW